MKMSSTELPTVDFSVLSLDKVKADEYSQLRENGSLIPLGKELVEWLQQFGLCYLKHPGISECKMNRLTGRLGEVLELPEESKKVYVRRDDVLIHGYVNCEIEMPDRVESVQNYEAFLTCPAKAYCWSEEVPDFKPSSLDLYRDLQELSYRALDLLAIGFELQDPSFFKRSHVDDHGELRQSLYHRCSDDVGEYSTDWENGTGEKWVKSQSGDWLDAEVIPDTVILMVGQMFQRWTSDKIKAPLHRVAFRADQESRRTDRFSMTFFPLTPDDFLYESIDGSNKYPAVSLGSAFKRYKQSEWEDI